MLQGNAGIILTILTIVLAVLVVLIVALSGIGVCERCKVESGGVYFLISHVLGSRIGGSVGVVYCFAQVRFNPYHAKFLIWNNPSYIFGTVDYHF